MAAFANNAMLKAQFPTAPAREGLRKTVEDKARADIIDPKATVMLVRDDELPDDEIIAFAKYSHPSASEEDDSEPGRVWPDGTDLDVLNGWV